MSRVSSFVRPDVPRRVQSINPRPLRPVIDPPAPFLLYPPLLPSGSEPTTRNPFIDLNFVLSSHIFPAAYPRTAPYISANALGRPPDDKEGRKAWAKNTLDSIWEASQAYQSANYTEVKNDVVPDKVLWHCVNRYVRRTPPKSERKSITLMLAHANGFSKETWEPFLRHLLTGAPQNDSSSFDIDEIWAFESVNHGNSALLNEGSLSACFDWADNARDILNFLTRYLPPKSRSQENLPLHLPRLSYEDAQDRVLSGFSDRTFIAIGHSFGGCSSLLSALTAPRLFHSLILIDPVITPIDMKNTAQSHEQVAAAVRRRSEWPSLNEARRILSTSPFFSAWDPEALESYLTHDLVQDDPTSETVRLKTTPIQEAAIFAARLSSFEAFERLRDLDPRIPVRFMMAGRGKPIGGSWEANRDMVWRRPENSSNVVFNSSGHLVPLEKPKDLAREVRKALGEILTDPNPHTDIFNSKL